MVRRHPQWRKPLLYWRERWLFAAVFLSILLAGLVATGALTFGRATPGAIAEVALIGVLAAFLCGLVIDRFGRSWWHAFSNAHASQIHLSVRQPRVIDGDTIKDDAANVTYRFANIDAPETGEGARCPLEAQRGELATLAVKAMVRRARSVTVRTTWRWDIYKRRVAFVYADGVDIGEALIAKGFARPWRGRRERWCGPRGGLAQIAKARTMPVSCKACGAWSSF